MEISLITNERWSEPTIKLYTRGTEVKDQSSKKRALKLLGELADMGLTLNDEYAISVKVIHETDKLSIGDVQSLINLADESSISLGDLFTTYSELKKANLTYKQLNELLSYNFELNKIGISFEGIKKLYETLKKYGSYEAVLKAVEGYGNLESIRENIRIVESRKTGLETDVKQ